MKKQKVCADLSTVFSNQSTNLSGLIIGERGCFSDSKDFSDYEVYKLIRVITTSEYPYEAYIGGGYSRGFKYYIPLNKANFVEEKKELRPFKTIDEFSLETGCEVLGEDFITIRNKNTKKVYVLLYVGYSDEEVHLGGYVLTFGDLLKNYEFLIDEWQSFGIEE